MQPEGLAVAAHQPHVLVRRHPPQRRPAGGQQHQPGVRRQLGGRRRVHLALVVQGSELGVVQGELGHPGPAGVDGAQRPVLVGVQAHRRRLDPQRHVLGDQADVGTLGPQVERHDHDPAVVAVVAEAGRQHRRVAVVELDVQRAAVLTDRHRGVEPAVLHPQVVEQPQRLPGEPAQLRVVALVLELPDHDEREDHVVSAHAQQRTGVGEQDGGVEDVRAASAHASTSLALRERVPMGAVLMHALASSVMARLPLGRGARPGSKVAGPRPRGRAPAPLVDVNVSTNRASRGRRGELALHRGR